MKIYAFKSYFWDKFLRENIILICATNEYHEPHAEKANLGMKDCVCVHMCVCMCEVSCVYVCILNVGEKKESW